ncbi:response regulator [Dongia sp.]|uniref:response regulator n=1 Tax=Dongia sp. TaxID=1977262 RepID=UPI0037520D26
MPGTWVVFIVDRDSAVRDSLRFSIELDGMNARTCGSGRELLEHPELDNGCCAVIDGRTLGHDGAEVATELQARRHILPLILILDHVSQRPLSRLIDLDLFHVVQKPVLDDALLRCVRAVRRFEGSGASAST